MEKENEETVVEEEQTEVTTTVGTDSDDDYDEDEAKDFELMTDLFPGDKKPLENTQADSSDKTLTEESEEEEQGAGQKASTPEEPSKEDSSAKTPEEVKPKEEAKPADSKETEQQQMTEEDRQAQLEQLQKFDRDARAYLVDNVYKLSEEEAEELETDPVTALPKLAANMHLQVMRSATLNVARLLPMMIEQIQSTQSQSKSLEDKFYDAHPGLAEHKGTVLRYGQVYRQMNPQATVEDFIRDVGAQASVGLGIVQQPKQQQQQPVVQQTSPHSPALAGRQQSTPARMAPTNEFERIAEEFLTEDD